jgi:hypothetical protein
MGRAMMWAVAVSVCGAGEAWAAGAAPTGDETSKAATVILDEASQWRAFWMWRTPVVRRGAELREGPNDSYGPGYVAQTEPPPSDWVKPECSDGAWSRWWIDPGQRPEFAYGFQGFEASGPPLALLCLRGRFAVADPAQVKGLTLSLVFRGGAVVYVNGREIARAFLPKDGPISADTLAHDYPPEAFNKADGLPIRAEFSDPKNNPDRVAKRIRRIEDLAIDPKVLRAGVNVLAIELHRAPYFGNGLEKENLNYRSIWSTCGLVSATLAAESGVGSNRRRPTGVQVWATSALHRSRPVDYADPLAPAEPVAIVGCRNGAFTGKISVTSDGPLTGVAATVSDLRRKGGDGLIPPSAVQVLYTVRDDVMLMRHRAPDGFWDTLLEKAPAKVDVVKERVTEPGRLGAVQPIVLKVRVPADAAPGDYEGAVAVTANGQTTTVPLRLSVIDWRLPDPRDYVTHLGLVESPESVALQYKVPLWSEEHWNLVEKSFQLIAEAGNKYLVLPLICRTNFGNSESLVRWVRDGEGWTYDFTNFNRYVDLAQKHQKTTLVCLYVWEPYTGQDTWSQKHSDGTPPLVTRLDSASGRVEEMEAPRFDSPAAKTTWAALYSQALEHLDRRGLKDQTMIGINCEWFRPPKPTADFFIACFPGFKWISNPHQDCRGGSVSGIPIGYHTSVYVELFPPPGQARRGAKEGRYFGWQTMSALFPRAGGPATRNPLYPASPLGVHRVTIEAGFLANFAGLGRTGADFWPVLAGSQMKIPGSAKRSSTITGRYPGTDWDQLNMDTATEALLAPGPDGATTTERFEQVRQGIQDCEARIVIEKAILSGRLDAETVARCWAVLDRRAWHIRAGCNGTWNYYEGAGAAPLAEELYATASDVTRRLTAPTP